MERAKILLEKKEFNEKSLCPRVTHGGGAFPNGLPNQLTSTSLKI